MRQVLAVMAAAQVTPEHLVMRVTPATMVLLALVALEVTQEIPVIQVVPEMLVGMVLADREARVVHTLQVLAAPGAQVDLAAVRVTPELQVVQVQVQPPAHQVTPVELELLVQRAILEQVEAVLLLATPEILAEQARLVARAT